MSYYQKIIARIDPTCNPRHVEAWMRLEYGILDHLERETFRDFVGIARVYEAAEPGSGERLALSFGL